MLFRHRRFFALAAFALLVTPLLVGVTRPDGEASVLKEGRRPAPPPQPPESFAALLSLPSEIDAYLKDRFGLRRVLIRAHKDLTRPVFGPRGGPVLIGRDGRMFYLGDEMVRQSAGLVLRDQKVSDVVDLLGQMKAELARRGVRLLVATPPNSSTIYQDDLPVWAQNRGRTTEYDLLLQSLADRGDKNCRPEAGGDRRANRGKRLSNARHPLDRPRRDGGLQRHRRGRRPSRLAARSRVRPGATDPRRGGDLVRMLGLEDRATETVEELELPPKGRSRELSGDTTPDVVLDTDEAGPTILVLGNFFTAGFFPPLISQHAGRVVWMHYPPLRVRLAADRTVSSR